MRSTRHKQLNDLIWRALKRADTPSTKKPSWLIRGDGKRSDGPALVPWQELNCLTWNARVVDTMASHHPTCQSAPQALQEQRTRSSAEIVEIVEIRIDNQYSHFCDSGD